MLLFPCNIWNKNQDLQALLPNVNPKKHGRNSCSFFFMLLKNATKIFTLHKFYMDTVLLQHFLQDLEKKKCTWFIMETCTKLHTTYIRYIKYWNMALSKCLANFSNNWFKSNKCSYSRSAVWWVINRKMTHKKCTDHMQIKTYEIRILFSAWLTHKIKPLTDSRV